MSLLNNIKNATNAEQDSDFIPGTGFEKEIFESGLYKAKILMAYVKPSSSGAIGVHFTFEINSASGEKKTFENSFWITNRNQENFYTTKDGKQYFMRGYNQVNDLCKSVLKKSISEINTEDKTVQIYNFQARKKEPEIVPVITELLERDVILCLIKIRTNKQVKAADGSWQDSQEEVYKNEIDKILINHESLAVTRIELENGDTSQKFATGWVTRWKGKERDQYAQVAAPGTTAPASAGSTTTATLDIS